MSAPHEFLACLEDGVNFFGLLKSYVMSYYYVAKHDLISSTRLEVLMLWDITLNFFVSPIAHTI